jgi:hypothetical protein
MSAVAPWDKRLRTPTLRAISQNQSLGARYFRFEPLSDSFGRPAGDPLINPVDVLEELANHGRCIVVLPDESRLGLYVVEPEAGESRLVWYEPCRLLPPPTEGRRWAVTVEAAVEFEGKSLEIAYAHHALNEEIN